MKFCSFVLAAAPIVSVGLYQENVAVVTRAVTPKDGSALVRVGAHEPFGGSFWYSSKTPLLSLADFNLALYAHENGEDGVAGLKSLFGHFVDGGGKGGF